MYCRRLNNMRGVESMAETGEWMDGLREWNNVERKRVGKAVNWLEETTDG